MVNGTHAAKSREVIAVQAHYWLFEFDAGDVSSADQARFIRWLNASPSHWSVFTDLLGRWRRWDEMQRLGTKKADPAVVDKWLRRRRWRRSKRTGSPT